MASTLGLGGAFAAAELLTAPFTTFGMLLGLSALAQIQANSAHTSPRRGFSRRGDLPEQRGLNSGLLRFARNGKAADKIALSDPGFHAWTMLASGVLFGAAACIKQTTVFEAAALAIALAINGGAGRLKMAGAFAAGFCAVPLVFAAYYFAIGHLRNFVEAAGIAAIQRAETGYLPWGVAFRLLLAGTLPVLPAVLMAGIFWIERRALRQSVGCRSLLFLAAWAGGALLGALATKAMFVIYLLPLLQPLCLAAGGFVEHTLGRLRRPWPCAAARAAVLAAAALYSSLFAAPLYFAGDKSAKAAEAAAALMAAEGAGRGDPILVVDWDLLVYVMAEAEPAMPIFHPQQLLCNFPVRGAATALLDAMGKKPAFVVMAYPAEASAAFCNWRCL